MHLFLKNTNQFNRYPLLINSEVSWHQDVTGGAPIKKEHDIHLLKNGFKSLGFEILD